MACRTNFLSNGRCVLYKPQGFSRYGVPRYRSMGKFSVGISKFLIKEKELSIRVDRSSSKGMAYENVADVVLSIVPKSRIAVGDAMMLNKKHRLRVVWVRDAFDLTGVLDHYVVGLNFWDEING